jgi:hypothetical protein
MHGVLGCVAANKDNSPPKNPVGVDAQKTVTKSDKASYMENGVWHELV